MKRAILTGIAALALASPLLAQENEEYELGKIVTNIETYTRPYYSATLTLKYEVISLDPLTADCINTEIRVSTHSGAGTALRRGFGIDEGCNGMLDIMTTVPKTIRPGERTPSQRDQEAELQLFYESVLYRREYEQQESTQ